jgi:polyhydroxyalkanoate synthesis regulator protein
MGKNVNMLDNYPNLVIKYPNRKLYSVNHRKYVSLRDIWELYNDCSQVKVLAYPSYTDISVEIMLQVASNKAKVDRINSLFNTERKVNEYL